MNRHTGMNTKNIITTTVVVAAVALAAVVPVLAKEDSDTPTTTNRPGLFQRIIHPFIRESVRTQVTASSSIDFEPRVTPQSDTVKTRIADAKKGLLQRWWDGVNKRLAGLIGRQSALADKIQSRITVLANQNADTTQAQTDLNVAKADITASGTVLAGATAQVPSIIADNAVADAITKLRALHVSVLAAIRTSQKALVQVATDIKVVVQASPTP